MTNKKEKDEYKETDKGFVKTQKIDHVQVETIIHDQGWEELRDTYKIPFGCHACGKLMYNWDKQFFYRYGVCADCTVDFVEDRDLPAELLRDRKQLLDYVKKSIEEKKNRVL